MTIITTEQVKSIVGDFSIDCETNEHKGQCVPAVAYVKIAHGCPKPHREWLFICAGHLANLKAGKVTCRLCLKTIPASGIRML